MRRVGFSEMLKENAVKSDVARFAKSLRNHSIYLFDPQLDLSPWGFADKELEAKYRAHLPLRISGMCSSLCTH